MQRRELMIARVLSGKKHKFRRSHLKLLSRCDAFGVASSLCGAAYFNFAALNIFIGGDYAR